MTINVLNNNTGYVMYNGKVQHIEITKVIRAYNEIKNTYSHSIECRIGGKSTILNSPLVMYKSEDGCISGCDKVGTKESNRPIDNIIGNKYAHEIYYWTSQGIESVSIKQADLRITPSTKKIWKENTETGKHEWQYGFDWKIEVINLGDKVYSSENLAMADHSFEVVESDGSTHIHPSYVSLATLTESQQVLFGNLIAAFKACEDAKVGIIMHTCDGCISAYNYDNDIQFNVGWEKPNDTSVAIDEILPECQKRLSATYTYMNDDDKLYAN